MISEPTLTERAAQPYVAIREKVTIPFTPVIDLVMPEVAGWLQARGVDRFGPAVFRYNVVDMPRLEVEMGFALRHVLGTDRRDGRSRLPPAHGSTRKAKNANHLRPVRHLR